MAPGVKHLVAIGQSAVAVALVLAGSVVGMSGFGSVACGFGRAPPGSPPGAPPGAPAV
ncbi:MAG TPA: hypothetical protein VFI47_15320 [Acidimicrobiales bacterium]|nr:hypothetical protein [Acidimicrobiales bacterium]